MDDPQLWGTYANGVGGVCTNLLLVYFILTDRTAGSNTYGTMLLIISSYNIYYVLVHCVVDLGILIDENGFLLCSKRFYSYGFWPSYLAVMVYVNAFTMSLTLLAIHCLYRYVKISGKWSFLFNNWYSIFVIIILHFLFGIAYVFFCHCFMAPSLERESLSGKELMDKYNITIHGLGYIGPIYKLPSADGSTHFIWKNMIGSFGCVLIMVICYAIIGLGCIKLHFFIRISMVSETTRRMHYQLLKLLLAQAISPLIFEYSPVMLTIFGGFWGLPLHNVSWYIPIFISAYAEADAIMVILFFKAYRRRCIRLLLSLYLSKDRMRDRFSFSNSVSRTQTNKNRISSIAIGTNTVENGEQKN